MLNYPACNFSQQHKEINCNEPKSLVKKKFMSKYKVISSKKRFQSQCDNDTKGKIDSTVNKKPRFSVNLSSDSSDTSSEVYDLSSSESPRTSVLSSDDKPFNFDVCKEEIEKNLHNISNLANEFEVNTPMYNITDSKKTSEDKKNQISNDLIINNSVIDGNSLKFKTKEEIQKKFKEMQITVTNSNSINTILSSIPQETQSIGDNSLLEVNNMLDALKTKDNQKSFSFTPKSVNKSNSVNETDNEKQKISRKLKKKKKDKSKTTIMELSEEELEDNLKSISKLRNNISKKNNQSIKSQLIRREPSELKENILDQPTFYKSKKIPKNFFEEKKYSSMLYSQNISLFIDNKKTNSPSTRNLRFFGKNNRYSLRNRIPVLNHLIGEKIMYIHTPYGDQISHIETKRFNIETNELYPRKKRKKLRKPYLIIEENKQTI